MRIVMKLDKQFSDGVKTKDSALLVNIYSDSAQYVQPKRPILTGKREIGQDWADFLRLKEQPIDLVLNIKDVRGTREVIYETGEGYTLVKDSTKWKFNYVNVWRLQDDKTYKLEIDTYN
jgi:ketosteroid isomerase-like protein